MLSVDFDDDLLACIEHSMFHVRLGYVQCVYILIRYVVYSTWVFLEISSLGTPPFPPFGEVACSRSYNHH